ncbi:MAG: hypothetical protein ACQXXJ_03040 [Candidatus Bathyarchaeia archaeon]|jgi:uncharacterized membrane protein
MWELNSDEANVCSKCGTILVKQRSSFMEMRHHRHRAGAGALMAGLIIIILGFIFLISDVWNINIPWWPLVIIAVGVWLVARSVMRQRKYR